MLRYRDDVIVVVGLGLIAYAIADIVSVPAALGFVGLALILAVRWGTR